MLFNIIKIMTKKPEDMTLDEIREQMALFSRLYYHKRKEEDPDYIEKVRERKRITYHATLTTIQGSELLVNLTMNSLVSSYDIASAIMNWLNTNVSEEVELNTSPPISVHSSPPVELSSIADDEQSSSLPITVNSSSTHTVNSSSSEENPNYEIAPPTDIPVPTGVDGDESEIENDEDKNKENLK